jgi:ketosteroid isomerase-like protein
MTREDLDVFFTAGWNGHDVDRLMTFMAEDCVFESASGPQVCGTRHVGRARVREAFARIFTTFPDVRFVDTRHVVAGDRGLSGGSSRGRPPTAGRSRSAAATCSPSARARSPSRARS